MSKPCHSLEEINRQKTEDEILAKRCREIFWQIHPQLIQNYCNWFIYIEPESGDYFLDSDRNAARQQARKKYPAAKLMAMCINETGAVGKI